MDDAEDDKPCSPCSICWDDMAAPYIHLSCGHRFHAVCLEQWARRAANCPMCREEFTWNTAPATVSTVAEDAANGIWLLEGEYWWQSAIQLVVMMSGALTAFRFLAILFPHTVDTMFRRYIMAGKELSIMCITVIPRLAPILSTLTFGLLLCL